MTGMYSEYSIRSVLKDPKGETIRIGPGLTDSEYGTHLSKLFEFIYTAAGEMRDNPQEPAHGYLGLALDCAIEEAKEINASYMKHPNPHVVAWTRHIRQFDNREKVVDTITALAETVCPDEYNGATAANMHREMKKSLWDASVPIHEILDGEEPPIRIMDYDQRRRRLSG